MGFRRPDDEGYLFEEPSTIIQNPGTRLRIFGISS